MSQYCMGDIEPFWKDVGSSGDQSFPPFWWTRWDYSASAGDRLKMTAEYGIVWPDIGAGRESAGGVGRCSSLL